MWARGCAAMAPSLLRQFLDIPDGTECHRKAYASTGIAGAVGERRPAPAAEREGAGGHGAAAPPEGPALRAPAAARLGDLAGSEGPGRSWLR